MCSTISIRILSNTLLQAALQAEIAAREAKKKAEEEAQELKRLQLEKEAQEREQKIEDFLQQVYCEKNVKGIRCCIHSHLVVNISIEEIISFHIFRVESCHQN
jgi:hypothetical protein